MASRRLAATAVAVFLLLCCASLAAQAPREPQSEPDREDPAAREAWFHEGRALRGESAAALRLRALRQKELLRGQHSSAARAAQSASVAGASNSSAATMTCSLIFMPLLHNATIGLTTFV